MNLFFLRDIKIWQKMMILLQIMSIPTIIIFITFLFMMNKLHDIESKILLENVSNIRAAYKVEISILNLKGINANYILNPDKKWLKRFKLYVKDFNYWYNKAFTSAKIEAKQNILSAMSLDFENYSRYHKKIVKLVDEGKELEAINLLLSESSKNYYAIYQGCEKLIKKNEEIISKSEIEVKTYLDRSVKYGYLTIACFILIGIMFVIIISKSIIDPINEIEKGADSVISNKSNKSEIARLKESFEKMINTIKENQQRLIQSEKKAAIGEIAAGISHELNNPIGIICGFSERLLQKKSLPKKEKESIQDIYKEAVRCKNLLGQLLDFAKSPQPNYSWTGIKSLLRNIVKIFNNQEKYKNIEFTLILPREPLKIYIDSVQIRQVFLNIILNSCEAMNNSGIIKIEMTTARDTISIKIRDNGPGIKPDNLGKIFTPFFSTKPKGTGLGLAVCKDIIEKNNGAINVYSEYEKYSEFIITLPRGKHE